MIIDFLLMLFDEIAGTALENAPDISSSSGCNRF
jgi:hypothetical protein